MWGAVLCLLVVGARAQHSGNNVTGETRFSRGELRLFGAQQTTDVQFADMKYMTYIFNSNNNGLLGSGVVYTQHWVVTTTAAVDGFTADVLAVKFDARLPDSTNGLDRAVKQVVDNPDCDSSNPLVNCVSLLRICPSVGVDHVATIASAIASYQSPGTAVHLLGFMDFETGRSKVNNKALIQALMLGNKKVGETCECDEDPNFDPARHVCLAESLAVFGEDTADSYDLKGLVLTNPAHTEVAGFLVSVTSPDVGGEIVLFLLDQQTFLAANAV